MQLVKILLLASIVLLISSCDSKVDIRALNKEVKLQIENRIAATPILKKSKDKLTVDKVLLEKVSKNTFTGIVLFDSSGKKTSVDLDVETAKNKKKSDASNINYQLNQSQWLALATKVIADQVADKGIDYKNKLDKAIQEEQENNSDTIEKAKERYKQMMKAFKLKS